MLRMGFMPSDFHPVLLFLGERDEFQPLVELLQKFAEGGQSVDLRDDGRILAKDVAVKLVPKDDGTSIRSGLHLADRAGTELHWALTSSQAQAFVEQIVGLVSSNEPAGSITLACGELDEIKVVVSFGEWEDGFLLETSS